MNTVKVRQNVFETNSSSTHSICIAKNSTLELPKQVEFKFGEFGWEKRTLNSVLKKASYLYTGLKDNYRLEDIEKIKQYLTNKNIEYHFEESKEDRWNNGYVDHSDELTDFLDYVCSSENNLLDYLFSPLSFILTGNDNNNHDVSIKVNYEHDKFFKGN
jgi:hypothetical protein